MEVKVVRVSETYKFLPGGTTERLLLIQYMVGEHGPFTLSASAAELESGEAKRKMEDFARNIGSL